MLTFATALALNTVVQVRLMGMSLTFQVISHKPKYWTNRLFAYDVTSVRCCGDNCRWGSGSDFLQRKHYYKLWKCQRFASFMVAHIDQTEKPQGDFSEYQKLLFSRGKNARN